MLKVFLKQRLSAALVVSIVIVGVGCLGRLKR